VRSGLKFSPPMAVHSARFTPPPEFAVARKKRRSGARRQGQVYEEKVQKYLQFQFEDHYVPSPWIVFSEGASAQRRFCQPDGLLFSLPRRKMTIIEIKLRHTVEAFYQTRLLYLPVLQTMFPSEIWEIAICEVCKWYDPGEFFPESPQMLRRIEEAQPGRFGVHIWNMSRSQLYLDQEQEIPINLGVR
jgi:hypothetical protein